MRASLSASATAATFFPRRASSARAERESRSVLCLAWRNTVRAPWMGSVADTYLRAADPQQHVAYPAGVLAWRQAETRRHRAAIGIVSGIATAATIAVAVRAPQARVGHRACGFVHPRHKPVAPVHHNRQSVRRAPATAVQVRQRLQGEPGATLPRCPRILTKPGVPAPALGKDNTVFA